MRWILGIIAVVAWSLMLVAIATRSLIGSIVAHVLFTVLCGAFALWFMATGVIFWCSGGDRAHDQEGGRDRSSAH
jgi:hypothetical protein